MKSIIFNRRLVSVVIAVTFFVTTIFVASGEASAVSSSNADNSVESCEQVQAKLFTKTDEFTQKRQDHSDKYWQISQIFGSVTETLEKAGYDIDLIKELQPGLDRRITTFSDTSQGFINEMSDAANSACRDEQSFSQELDEARESLKSVQSATSDIQKYVQEIIIPAIVDTIDKGAN